MEEMIEELADLEDLDLICIDHLHYFDMGESREFESIQLGKIMRKLRDITKKGIPVILASHLKTVRDNKPPQNHDLFGSSNIAKEATNVILLHREDDETILRITKNRNGGVLGEWRGIYNFITREIDFGVGPKQIGFN